MSLAVSLPIPCLGTSKPYYSGDREIPPLLDTKTKVAFVFSAFLLVVGLALLPFLPHVGVTCLAVAGLGVLVISLYNLVKLTRVPDLTIKKLENLESAKQLAVGIDIPPALNQELVQIIPVIDAMQADDRIASVHYHCDNTATFRLKTAPHLQFRISAPCRMSGSCEEFYLTFRYENKIYAHDICLREQYDALVVPSVKPLYLTVGGLGRLALAEVVVQKMPGGNLERAVRQMVGFLLKTGGADHHVDPIPFIPLAGGKLALDNLYHLTENPHPEGRTREYLEVRSILGERNSLLAALDREDLIDIALDELKKLRPVDSTAPANRGPERRLREIQRAKAARLERLHKPVQVAAARKSPRNILRITSEELGLDLNAKDYAVIRRDGVHSDGVCRIITLGEVARAIIDRINRKLEANPGQARIEFTPEELLIGEKLPTFTWEKHYQYNMLQGLGYRGWPDPNQEPPYWMALVLQALKNKGLITNFTLPDRANPTVDVNLRALTHS